MNRLNKTFHNNDVLDAQELNDIVGKTNELVDAANTASAVTGIAVTGVEGEETEDGFVVSVSKKDGDSTFTIPTSETMTSAGLMTLDDKAKLDSIGEGASKEILPYDGDAIGVVVVDIYVNAPDGVYWNGTRFVAKKGNSYYSGWNDEEGEYVNANDYQENGLVKMDKVFYNKSNGDRKVTKTGTNLESLGSDVDLSAYLTKVEAQSTYAGKYAATAAYDGLMSAADKAKLDDIDGWTHEALHIAAFVENITPESVSPAGPAQDICFDSVRNSFYWRLYNRLIPIEQQEVKYALSTTADGSLNAYNKDGQWFTMGDRCFVWFSTGMREVLAANLEDYVKRTSSVVGSRYSSIGYEDGFPALQTTFSDGRGAYVGVDEDGACLKGDGNAYVGMYADMQNGGIAEVSGDVVELTGREVKVNGKPVANTDLVTADTAGLMSAADKTKLDVIDPNNIQPKSFVATYGTTTYQEIINAKNAGKDVVCYYGGILYHRATENNGEFINLRKDPDGRINVRWLNVDNSNVWTYGNYELYKESAERQKYINAGATYNAITGLYSLNGLTDITGAEMSVIYEDTYRKQCGLDLTAIYANSKARTNFPLRNRGNNEGDIKFRNAFFFCSKMEAVKVGEVFNPAISGNQYYGYATDISEAFYGCTVLKKIIGVINVEKITDSAKVSTAFHNSNALEDVQILRLKVSLTLASPVISYDSLRFLVDHAANTSIITVTVDVAIWDILNGGRAPYDDHTAAEWQQINADAMSKHISFAY